jgi:predicted Zn-dependent protease
VDAAKELGADPSSANPPAGREILLEHVHFNWDGNVLMGRRLAEASALALFGAGAPPGRWLDAQGCARAVGYTDLGRVRMLRQMEAIRGKPPFTGQLSFGEDQVRYQRELALAEAAAANPENLAEAVLQLEAAAARSPQVPSLQLRLAEAHSQSNHPLNALECIDRVLALTPPSPEVLVMRARALAALHRNADAEDAVLDALRMDPCNLPSYTALVEILRSTGDFARGREVFQEALAGNPGSGFIRLSYADLLFFHGDRDLAVRECLSVLATDGADPDALRRLVSLYTQEGRKQQAFDLMVAARAAQPLNFENNLGLARIYDERGDGNDAADCLLAATRSGPATAEVHIYLARRLSKLGRPQDALVELARARRVAILSGDPEKARHIEETMALVGRD